MKRITKWRAAARRDLIEPNGEDHNRRTKAEKAAKAGQVHRGDRKSSKTKPRKKTSART
ncbi:hypothetical protein IVB38_35340 [Bradyrhizobium sp. 38]|jgi:hypothetical protein|uniref:hypothetical protein n=1 Tax=unclassified Bradyrhizobium TaxID=2631580 RepID=UPI001FF9F392|nr:MULTISPECIES: hypothetical protein [unclassified Bradyrhizobium]MCK1341134.1 hypothetical protein [Bradyrhizobium sp. 38]MCK1777164.1 hypothetical protein [Bradyrhizobium sp. 132]